MSGSRISREPNPPEDVRLVEEVQELEARIPSLACVGSGPVALQNIWNAMSATSPSTSRKLAIAPLPLRQHLAHCFGSRDTSAGCRGISAKTV